MGMEEVTQNYMGKTRGRILEKHHRLKKQVERSASEGGENKLSKKLEENSGECCVTK